MRRDVADIRIGPCDGVGGLVWLADTGGAAGGAVAGAQVGAFDEKKGREESREEVEEGGEVKRWTSIDGGILKMFFALASDGDELSKKAAQVGIATLSPSRRAALLRAAKNLVEWSKEVDGEESAHRREKKPGVKKAIKKPAAKKAKKNSAKKK